MMLRLVKFVPVFTILFTYSVNAFTDENNFSLIEIRSAIDKEGWLSVCRQYGDDLKHYEIDFTSQAESWKNAVFVKAGCLSETRRDFEATKLLENALTIDPTQPLLWDMLGTSYLRMKQPEKAIDALQNAIDRGRDGGSLHSKLANAYLQIGAPLQGKDNAIKKAKLLKLAEENLLEAIRLENLPNSPVRVVELGSIKMIQGENSEAIELFNTALRRIPNYKYWDDRMQLTMRAEYTMLLGQATYNSGDKTLGIAHMESAITLAPSLQLKDVMRTIIDHTINPAQSIADLEKREPELTSTPFIPLNE